MQEEVIRTGAAAQSFLEQANLNWMALVKIVFIISLCIGAFVFLRYIKGRLVAFLKHRDATRGKNARDVLLTLIPLGESMMRVLIIAVGGVSCLSAVHISVSPFVYCLGFLSAGLALGAQDTFTDIIRGILTLAEGRFSVGDYVSINGVTGYVETMTIRQITIRHDDGSIEAFPFSKIGTIQNFSVGDTVMGATFCLAPDSDVALFEQFTQEVLEEMLQEGEWKRFIVRKTPKSPELEFQSVTNSGVVIKVTLRIRNDADGIFASEFNLRMWKRLQNTTMLRRA